MSHRPLASVAVLLLASCGVGASQTVGSDTPNGQDPDAGRPVLVLPDGGAPDDDAGIPPSLLVDAAEAAAPRVCGPSSVAALPTDYQLGAQSFDVDSIGMDFSLVPSAGTAVPPTVAAVTLNGAVSTLDALPVTGMVGESLSIDSTSAYFLSWRLDAAGASALGLYSVPRTGGAESALAIIPNATLAEIALGSEDVWVDLQDTQGGSALYAVPKSGGAGQGLGAPAYVAPAGSQITGLFVDGSTLYWVEVAAQQPGATENVTIRFAQPGAVFSTQVFATFAAGGGIRLVEVSGTVFFTFEPNDLPLPSPIPMIPPPPHGTDSGPPWVGPMFGLYSITQGGAPVLVDSTVVPPVLAGVGGVYYVSRGTTSGSIDSFAVGASAANTLVPLTAGLSAMAVGTPNSVYFALPDGCVYADIPFGP